MVAAEQLAPAVAVAIATVFDVPEGRATEPTHRRPRHRREPRAPQRIGRSDLRSGREASRPLRLSGRPCTDEAGGGCCQDQPQACVALMVQAQVSAYDEMSKFVAACERLRFWSEPSSSAISASADALAQAGREAGRGRPDSVTRAASVVAAPFRSLRAVSHCIRSTERRPPMPRSGEWSATTVDHSLVMQQPEDRKRVDVEPPSGAGSRRTPSHDAQFSADDRRRPTSCSA